VRFFSSFFFSFTRRAHTRSPPKNPNPLSPLSSPQDGTLVLPRLAMDAKWAPANATDWRFFNPGVPAKLRALVEDGYELVVLR
jgi:hypothetical protein